MNVGKRDRESEKWQKEKTMGRVSERFGEGDKGGGGARGGGRGGGEGERYASIIAFPPGVFGLHDFICEP